MAGADRPTKMVVYESFSLKGVPGGEVVDYVDLPSGPTERVVIEFCILKIGWDKIEGEY